MKSFYAIVLAIFTLVPTHTSTKSYRFSKDQKYALINGISTIATMGALLARASMNPEKIERQELYLALSYCGFFGLKQAYEYVTASKTTIGEKSATYNPYRYLKAGLFGALSAALWIGVKTGTGVNRIPGGRGIAPVISLLAFNEIFHHTDDIRGDSGYDVDIFDIKSSASRLKMVIGACTSAAGYYLSSHVAPEISGTAIGAGTYLFIDGALDIEKKDPKSYWQ